MPVWSNGCDFEIVRNDFEILRNDGEIERSKLAFDTYIWCLESCETGQFLFSVFCVFVGCRAVSFNSIELL